jgi:hypothetical protein
MYPMHPALRRFCAAATAILAFAALLALAGREKPMGAGATLAADETLRWYRGNLHTHTLWSDGDDYPEMVARWYRDHDYDFLCFTDHNTLLASERWTNVARNKGKLVAYEKLKAAFPEGWIAERQDPEGQTEVRLKTFAEIAKRLSAPGEFLLIQGEEISDHFGKLPVHLNATNLEMLVPPMGGESIQDVLQRNVDAVLAQRERTGRKMFVHLNHPNFHYAITAEDLMRVRGENFFEVYNGHPSVHNSGNAQYASTERIWDIILTRRIAELELPLMYGLATDDGHEYHKMPSRASEPGRGWVMVLAGELTESALIDALEAGRFYASSGVELTQVSASDKRVELTIRAEEGVEYTTEFIGTRRGYEPESHPVTDEDGKPLTATRRYSADIGRVLHTVVGAKAAYDIQPDELYVRARVTSSKRHPNPSEPDEFERAWTQPVLGPK